MYFITFLDDFSKDLISSVRSDPIERRSGVAGYAFLSGVCNPFRRYAIAEEFGGFFSIEVKDSFYLDIKIPGMILEMVLLLQ